MRLVNRLLGAKEWRILSLEAIYAGDRLAMAFAGRTSSKPLVLSKRVLAFPKAHRRLAFVMMRRGLRPRAGLPGEDDPVNVRQVLVKNEAWLRSSETT